MFPDGGYYLDNGATLCGKHHLEAESTKLSTWTIRLAAKIDNVVLPPHLYSDQEYTKWGDPILPNGQRLKGELFHDESVQKVLVGSFGYYTDYVKYPRTYHLPWSDNITDDDRVMPEPVADILDSWDLLVMTEKMDGENTTMYRDYIHARSIDGRSHSSRDWVKNFWSQIAHDIPEGWRVCGENVYAKHSIGYESLPSYFLGFSVWNDKNVCLGWEETQEWFELLGITPVRTIWTGPYMGRDHLHENWEDFIHHESEGYIVRNYDPFHYKDFRYNVGKYVRKNFAAGVKHWFYGQKVEANALRQN